MQAAFTGAVLCGGASRRMGQDKALLLVDGEPMVARVAAQLRLAGAAEVLAIGGDVGALVALGLDPRADDQPGAGPLAATMTALRAAREDLVLVLSCDLLRPSAPAMASTVRALVDHPGAVAAVPVSDGHRQWTHAAWRERAVPALEAAYEGGVRSLRRAGADLLVYELHDIDPSALLDADEPGHLP